MLLCTVQHRHLVAHINCSFPLLSTVRHTPVALLCRRAAADAQLLHLHAAGRLDESALTTAACRNSALSCC